MSCRCAAPNLPRWRPSVWGALASALGWLAVGTNPAAGITLQFNYAYDVNGFFGTAAAPTPARKALEFAARGFTAFTDTLQPIVPGGANAWTARFTNPTTGAQEAISNPVVPTNTIIIFPGARDLSNSRLGESARGIYALDNANVMSPGFINAVVNRGQGSTSADFAPWGGSIAFDMKNPDGSPRLWNFDPRALPVGLENDFLSTAQHELAHLLGFGVSESGSFQAKVQDGQFAGAYAMALYGGSIPLQADREHWEISVRSPPFAVDRPRAALGPVLFAGERLPLTPLDYAALADIGWEVPPELLRLPGDVDGDHDVDGADLLVWQRNVGGFGGSPGDVNGDLAVDDYDGWMIRQYFGASGAPLPASAAAPEPGGALLAIMGGAAILIFGFRIGGESDVLRQSDRRSRRVACAHVTSRTAR
jgi:hypothetical protein